jgi:hypothetical protein
MWATSGPRGQRVTAGLPGSGLFWTQKIPGRRAKPQLTRNNQGGMSMPVYALAGFLGGLPMGVRVVLLIILGAFALVVGGCAFFVALVNGG